MPENLNTKFSVYRANWLQKTKTTQPYS